jgi:diguanylate cyclase (GGDEF)-like protein
MANSSLVHMDSETHDTPDLLQAFNGLQREYKILLDRHTALFKLNRLSHDCANINVFYRQLHQTIASLLPAKNFYIVLYDQTFATLEFVYHVDEKDAMPTCAIPLDRLKGSLTHYVIETAKPLLATPEIRQQLSAEKNISAIGNLGTDWLGVPLMNDGFVIGVMAVQSYDDSVRYQHHDLEILNFAAQHIVSAMTRLQDHERLQAAVNARTNELMKQIREREKSELLQESLFHISELTNKADLDIDRFYAQVHNIVGQLLNAENFFIAKYDGTSETLNFVYFQDQISADLQQEFKTRKGSRKYTELVIRRGETLLLNQQEMQTLYEQGETTKPQAETKSWLGVPLKSAGQVIGAMVVQSYTTVNVYNKQDAEVLNFVSQHVSTAIKRREITDYERKAHELLEQQVKLRTAALEAEIKQRTQAEQKLKHSASHDSLTGLPNRSVFLDLLNHAIAYRKRNTTSKFAILFLDLDRFKVVNDSLGHYAGDLLLKVIANELRRIVRDMDTVARLGGDEFVILIEDIQSEQIVLDIADRITKLLNSPFEIENQPVFIGTSIGILFCDDRYTDADSMLRDADTAMYHAKSNGKGRYEVFDASMRNKVQNALTLEADMRKAIENKEFEPYFQPILDLTNQHVVGFEALARWHSEERGFVLPNDFIPLAEETNLVMSIDLQILEKSCQQLKRWQDRFPQLELYVSCNLFCHHFFNNSLAQDLSAILTNTGLSPRHLRIELTERALLEHAEIVQSNMEALKQLGVKILLDDFGTGYSSLSYLHRFPIDVLKIDRSFIMNVHEDANHRAIIKTIIDLAANLGMTTVGEGIENIEDAELLTQMDCHYGQGYYFAKPMKADVTERYLAKQSKL